MDQQILLLSQLASGITMNLYNHVNTVIRNYLTQNNISVDDWNKYGEYAEISLLQGTMGVLRYKGEDFHKFIYDPFATVISTWNK